MKKLTALATSTLTIVMLTISFTSCTKDEEVVKITETIDIEVTKSTTTKIKFAANGKECGITDGYANQQHLLPSLVHLNLDKCNGETYRPTITLNFESQKEIKPGTYTVVSGDVKPGASQFTITSDQYNYANWYGTAGSVVVTQNTEDATKIDIELKSITMTNHNNTVSDNPATDTLTGFIIKI